jgi:hypothetical protein
MSDPLERRMLRCSWSDESGRCDENAAFRATCGGCNNGLVPEPAEQWAKRCADEARKWEKVARWLAQYLSDWLGECPSGADVTPLPDCEKVCDSISVPECWIIAAAKAVEGKG